MLAGTNLGPYRILERIGRGGMATVYKAYQPSLDRYVGVKVLPAHLTDEPGFAQRFKRKARAVAMLEHPHILPVYDYGQEEDLTYIVIRYVEGGTLKELLGKSLELPLIVKLIGQVAEALDHAHEHGVVHRDVKPSNVLLDHDDWALLTDFGVARMVEATQQITATGVGVGTPAYMSPEQGQGKKVEKRSDVYSLGVMLYEMLTGRVPYEADTPLAVVLKHINEPLPLPSKVNPSVPEGVQLVVLKGMAKDPGDRYRTAGAMAEALGEAVREAEAIGPSPIGEKLGQDVVAEVPARTRVREGLRKLLRPLSAFARRAGRRRVWAWVTGTFALLGVVLIVMLAWTGSFEGRKPSPTEAAQLAIVATSPAPLEPASTEIRPTPGNTPVPATPTEGSLRVAPILTYAEGEVLFEDDFETGFAKNWAGLPESFTVFQEETGNYLLQASSTRLEAAVAGDASWQDYAV